MAKSCGEIIGSTWHRSVDSDGLEKCRLYRDLVPCTKTMHLSTSAGIQKSWAPRISLLLDIPVEQEKLSSQICSRCANRVESLGEGSQVLSSFRLNRFTGLKRTKETSGDVGVSPDTINDHWTQRLPRD